MGSLQHEPESISKSFLRPSSPLTPSAFDEGRLQAWGAQRFFMNGDDYDGGYGRKESRTQSENARDEAHKISRTDVERNARGSSSNGNLESKGWERVLDGPHEGPPYASYGELDAVQRKKAGTLWIYEDRTRLITTRRSLEDQIKLVTTRRSLDDIRRGGLHYKRERHSFGYGEEEKRALGVVHGHHKERGGDSGILGEEEKRALGVVHVNGHERGGATDVFGGEREAMAKIGHRGRESEKGYIRGGSDDRKEERGGGSEKREDGYERRRERGSVRAKVKDVEREKGNRGRCLEWKQEGKKEEGRKRESEEGKREGVDEVDYVHRGQWLRAAILGANDGLVSTASLMMGVGAAKDDDAKAMVVSGLAGLVGGACSMAIGEFISVYSQRDAERFDKKRKSIEEKAPPSKQHIPPPPPPPKDLEEGTFSLASYLSKNSSKQESTHASSFTNASALKVIDVGCGAVMQPCVAIKHLGTNVGKHKLEEEEESSIGPSPWEAAGASGFAFALGAMVPLLSAGLIQQETRRIGVMVGVCSAALLAMGGIGAKLSAGSIIRGSIRVLLGGWAAMLVTYGLLRLFRTSFA